MKIRHIISLIIEIMGLSDSIIVGLFFSGINTGVLLPGIIGIIIISFSVIKIIRKKPLINNRLIKAIIFSFLIIFILSFIILELIIIINSSSVPLKNDVRHMIILGAGLRRDRISPALYNRLNKALEILKNDPDVKVIVSGGKGPLEKNTEAVLMKEYLASHGVNLDNITVEDKSTSTYENFIFSKKLISGDVKKIYIVTNAFHSFRAGLIAKRAGFEPYTISARDPGIVFINCYLREYFALIKTFFLDK